MNPADDYILHNKQSWNNRVETHLQSDFYDNDSFLHGKSSLKEIELALLGDISGKSILHLQCHFGQDTISLSRLGAHAVGIDFSDKAIDTASEMAKSLKIDTRFICCDIYELPQYLDEQFDIVFTSYGTIGWLPDIDRWAKIVSRFLKPSGKFVFVEFHPFIWMYDDHFETVFYNYFNTIPIIEEVTGTYADKNASLESKTVSWNHDLSEVIQSLINNGLSIDHFQEYNYTPYNCFNGLEEIEPGKFRISKFGEKIPMVYSLVATKR
jgi:ubiquinone/menaquinone biosynthesis C-methylase UbiE